VNITTIKMKNLTHTLEIVVNINVFLLVLIVKYPPTMYVYRLNGFITITYFLKHFKYTTVNF